MSSTERRRVGVFTSTRADLGPLSSVIEALDADPRAELVIVATGTHLLASHGDSIKDLRVGPETVIEIVDAGLDGSEPTALARAFGNIAAGVSEVVDRHRLEIVLLLGDRWELLAAAGACLLHAVPIVHLHGGESTEGAIDERVRHGLTKLADLHLCATEDSARRIRQLGEERWRIVVTGAPGLDRLAGTAGGRMEELEAALGRRVERPFGIVAYHPTTVDRDGVAARARAVLDTAAARLGTAVVVYPGADPGADAVVAEIEAAAGRHPNLVVRPHLGDLYVTAMAVADVLVGNSSSGICEAATFELPVVDVGDRQGGRLRGENVVNVDEEASAIDEALRTVLDGDFRAGLRGMRNPYGDGAAGPRIADAVLEVPLERLARKPLIELAEAEGRGVADLLVGPRATVRDAMAAIDRGACEIALAVDERGRLLGTISDGDLRRSLLRGGTLDDPAIDVANRVPLTAVPGQSPTEVLALMQKNSLTQVPVVDEQHVVVGLHVMKALVGGLMDEGGTR